MSTFSGLNTATTALWAQRRGLDVTGQNVANVNTDGYSRQRADLQSVGGATTPAFFSTSNGVGGGVTADSVSRIRDAFLESRALTEHGSSAELTVADDVLTQVQDAFREPSDSGIQSLLSDVWAGWSDVANNPSDLPSRSQLIERTETLVEGLRTSRSTLTTQWSRLHDDLESIVQDTNATAANIATMNAAIQRATQSGQPTNELADKRDALVLQLAGQVGATARPGDDGMVDVVVGGVTLVSGTTQLALAVAGPTSADTVTSGDLPRIVTRPGGTVVRAGGTAGGEVTALGATLPEYTRALDQLAGNLASMVNSQHAKGYDLAGAPGGPLLGPASGTVTAANLTVLVTDPRKIAASSVGPSGGVAAVDHGNADAMAQLSTQAGNPDTAYRQLVVQLGVRAATANRDLQIQTTVTQQVDTDRQGVSGVDLDEEMTNMLSFQHAYSAAARLVTAIDETLDVLINRTGKVGL